MKYEIDSLRGRPIVIFIVSFVVLLMLSFWIVEKTLRHLNATTPPPEATSLVQQVRMENDAPKLQPTEAADHMPAEDLETLRHYEDDVFAKLGWTVDRAQHQATIPDADIERLAQSRQEARP